MDLKKGHFPEAQLLAIGVTGGLVWAFPGVTPGGTLAGLIFIWIVLLWIYERTGSTSTAGAYTLLGVMTVLSAGLVVNVHYFTVVSGGTVEHPVLISDSQVAWDTLTALRDGTDNSWDFRVQNYGRFLYLLSFFIGANIGYMLVLNVFFVMATIILTGAIAEKVCRKDGMPISGIRTTAMIMIASICFFLATGDIILKDALICFLMAVFVYACLEIRTSLTDPVDCRRLVLYSVAIMLVMAVAWLVRPNLLVFLCMGFVFMMPWRKRYGLLTGLMLIAVAACLLHNATYVSENAHEAARLVKESGSVLMYTEGRVEAYDRLMENYDGAPWYRQIVYLPITVIVQFVLPFPWNFTRDIIYAPTTLYARITYPWYFVGGTMVYCLLFGFRTCPGRLKRLSLYGVVSAVITAYVTAGTIPRYSLPWLPMLIPAAAWAWLTLRRRRTYLAWMTVYGIVLAAGLVVCHSLQSNNKTPEELWQVKSR